MESMRAATGSRFNSNSYYNNTRNLLVTTCYTCTVQNQVISPGVATDAAQPAVFVSNGSRNTVFPPFTDMPIPLSQQHQRLHL